MKKKTVILELRTSLEHEITRVLDSKATVAANLLNEDVHLGVLGARWTWCGLSKVVKVTTGCIFYVNHNKDKQVTCKKCLARIKEGSPVPTVTNILEIAVQEMRQERKISQDIMTKTHKQIMSLPIYTVTVRMKASGKGYYEREYDTRYPEAISGQIMGISLKTTGFQGVNDAYIEEAEKSK
jgi:hypothetical protein